MDRGFAFHVSLDLELNFTSDTSIVRRLNVSFLGMVGFLQF